MFDNGEKGVGKEDLAGPYLTVDLDTDQQM